MRESMTISSKSAAAAFASPQKRKIVQTLIGGEMTLAALAAALPMPMSLLHYHVAACLRLGLIKVVRERRRAGRAAKVYRAAAKSFFVPSEMMVDTPGAEMTRDLRAALDRNVARSLKGVTFTHDGQNPCLFLVKEPAGRAGAIELWLNTGLSAADAAELMQDLEAVMNKFRSRGSDRQPRYLVHLAAVKA
jgi:DNA-binding transcriptional ArsR family regulator